MSLDLDNRQLAMLREMGIRLWQAPGAQEAALEADSSDAGTPVAAAPVAAAPVAAAPAALAPAQLAAQSTPITAPAPLPVTRPTTSPAAAADATLPAGLTEPASPAWQLASPQSVYPANPAPGTAIRWLLLAELPPGASQPLEGEAGQLLDNMLRAAGMHLDADLKFVALQRGRPSEAASEGAGLADPLTRLIDAEQPSAVLVMGRLAAQALLPSPEPFAKRRGQALVLSGRPLLLMNDATYLLRNLPEKAKAWEDLCLARTLAVQARAQ